ncbi:MAG: ATP-binding protein [Bacteroidales bacterium]|nr:ATP-binding protein [Bacteroidales bacterium]
MDYFPRQIEAELHEVSKKYPVITITGPRQSGKTTLVRTIFNELPYYNLENPDVRALLKTDPRSFINANPAGAIIDEVQHVPELLSYLQQTVDERKIDVTYVLTGSNQFSILNSISQSLAGRTAILKLLPLSLNEILDVLPDKTDDILYRGFYPAIYSQDLNPTKSYRYYYETYLERDLRQMIQIKDLDLFQKFIRICAGRIGNIFNASSIANEIGASVPTIKSWMSILQASYIVMLLQPYYENINKRLIKSPKIYFYDVGLASYLLGIEDFKQISRDPLRGGLFENLIVMELVKYRFNQGLNHNLYFYRDSHHNEIDIVFKKGQELYAFEIKSAQTFHPGFLKGLNYFDSVFNDRVKQKFLVYDGTFEHVLDKKHVINFRNLTSSLLF